MHNPKFASFASLFGGHGTRVIAAEDFAGAITKALQNEGPALVEVIKDAELAWV